MGIEPDDTFEHDLDADADLPGDRHRVLIVRHGTARHWLRFAARVKAIRSRDDMLAESYVTDLEAVIAPCLVGWRGIAAPFDSTPLGDVLQTIELEHLAETLPVRARVGEYEKKALQLRSRSASASAAPAAPEASASASGILISPGPASSANGAAAPGADTVSNSATGS